MKTVMFQLQIKRKRVFYPCATFRQYAWVKVHFISYDEGYKFLYFEFLTLCVSIT